MSQLDMEAIVQSALEKARNELKHPPADANPFAHSVTVGGAVAACHFLLIEIRAAKKRAAKETVA